MLKTSTRISHNKKQVEKIKTNFVSKSLKLRDSMHTKDLTKENKLLKAELKKVRQAVIILKQEANDKEDAYVEIIHCMQGIFDKLPGHIYWKNRKHLYTMCNAGWAKTVGLKSHKEVEGKLDSELMDKKYSQRVEIVDEEVMRNDERRVLEELGQDVKGNPATYFSVKAPLHGEKGEVIGLVGVSIDITERKKYEALLHEEKEQAEQAQKITADFIAKMKYEITGQKDDKQNTEQSAQEIRDYLENIISLIPGNIYWKDRLGRYLFWNKHALGIMGLKSCKEIVGKTAYDLFDKDLAELTTVADEHVMESDQMVTTEEKGLDIDGNSAMYLTRKIPLHDLKGKVIGLLGVSLDITERKKAAIEALQLAKEKGAAEERMKTVELFSGFLAHELGNAVSGVKINADVLAGFMPVITQLIAGEKEIKDCKKELATALDTIKRVGNAANSAEKIFNITLMNMKTAAIPKERMQSSSIKQDIEKAIAAYPYRTGEEKKISFTGADFTYVGIPVYTEHVFLNLIKNAYCALEEEGKGKITITTKPAKAGDQYHQVIFKDTGSGIAAEFMPKLFQRFASNWQKGTGLGLAFCKTYMEAIGGNITCTSKSGEYTEFTLLFPVILG